ncbi:MAG: hypothetical protein V4548_08465 [Bacteroidota bacterium]
MPKINNPTTGHGKMLIQYKGKNELLLHKPPILKRFFMQREKQILKNVRDNLVIETELIDGTTVCFSIKSADIYIQSFDGDNKIWKNFEEDCLFIESVNIDNEFVIFKGSLNFNKEIIPEFISREVYEIVLFFKNSKDLMELLDKNEIEYL